MRLTFGQPPCGRSIGSSNQNVPLAISANDFRTGSRLRMAKARYDAGDMVTWDLGGNVPHIGIVVDRHPIWSSTNLVLHNVGEGPKIEDVLFRWKITGHYRYYGPSL
jgi:uncharacterized protein YijF (DUF1287 family)